MKKDIILKWFWISYSLANVGNQGVLVIQGEGKEAALENATLAKLAPANYNDVEIFEIENEEIPANKLHSQEDMAKLGYGVVVTTGPPNSIEGL